MGHHSGRLGHHHQVIVLVSNRHRIGIGLQGAGFGHRGLHGLPTGQPERLRPDQPVHGDPALGDGSLGVGPGDPQARRNRLVQPARRRGEGGGHVRRFRPVRATRIAPITMAESATLNTGHTWKSMKSTTRPEIPGPRMIRSVRFPNAPPRTSPMEAAVAHDPTRGENHTMASTTRPEAAKNSHGARWRMPNAPPELVVYESCSTCGISTRARPRSRSGPSAQSLVTRSRRNAAPATAYRDRARWIERVARTEGRSGASGSADVLFGLLVGEAEAGV